MAQLGHLLKKYWYLVLLGVVIAAYFVVKVMSVGKVKPPDLSPIKDAITTADTDAKVAKAESKVTADTERAEVERIKKIDDGAERRKRIVEMLERLDASNG